MALANILPPGYRAFKAVQEQNQQGELAELQKAQAVRGMLAQMQAEQRERAFASDLAGLQNPTQEQMAQVAAKHVRDPRALMQIQQQSLDRNAQIAATKEATLSRLEMQRQFEARSHEARMTGLKNDQARLDETARHNKVMEGINTQLAQIRGDAAKSRTAPKPPKDYEWTDDTYTAVRPIAGGPKDTAPKDLAKAKGAIQKADTIIASVNEALTQTGPMTTGAVGAALGMVPGTSAYDLDGTLDTIKANLGFAELQAMRDASPTGGALGQVAIQELQMLQSTLASLKRGLGRAKLEKGLKDVRTHMENWKKAVSEANPDASAPPSAPAAPTAPASPTAAPSASGWTVREKK